MTEDRKKYDTDDTFTAYNAYITKDAEQKTDTLVIVTFPSESRREGDKVMWVEAMATDSQHDAAKFIKKGDVLPISGKLTFRTYTNKSGELQVGFNLRNARFHFSPSFIGVLKERGWVPGQQKDKGAPARPAPTTKKKVVELGDDE